MSGIVQVINKTSWLQHNWTLPSVDEETNKLLSSGENTSPIVLCEDVEEIIKRSKNFPIPFPVQTIRLESLKEHRPVDRLKQNIVSTYPVVHERVLVVMARFLQYKKKHGSDIEKKLYENMTVPELIDRLLKKRAVAFVGRHDACLLINGLKGIDGWESVGTQQERQPLVLNDVLSYDEMKLSALLYVSGYTECINDGARNNCAVVQDENIVKHAVIIGAVGPRFKRLHRMDYEDIIISKTQNTVENGYGEHEPSGSCLDALLRKHKRETRRTWRQLWAEFYLEPSLTYDEVVAQDNEERFVSLPTGTFFDNQVYSKRIHVIAETLLLEAEQRGADLQKETYLNLVGFGLGVWMISEHQTDVFVLTMLERIRALLQEKILYFVTDVTFAYIEPSERIKELFVESEEGVPPMRKLLFESDSHSVGGITVRLEKREPSSIMRGVHSDKLLVMAYPWDSNALPGNEFWEGSLKSSGDPAAACSTQVAELHNPHINPAVSGNNTRAVSCTYRRVHHSRIA